MSRPLHHQELYSVRVPPSMIPIFATAQECIEKHFKNCEFNPERAAISISGERYLLVRASSLSTGLVDLVMGLYDQYPEAEARAVARDLLFDIGHAMGQADAQRLHAKLGIEDPLTKLSLGPVHCAYTGWANVEVHPDSRPSADQNYFLHYDHPNSFEAEDWMQRGRSSPAPVCVMNAGYSSGWCAESIGIDLVAAEIECRAMGHARCRFIMAPPDRIEGYLDESYPERKERMPASLSRIPVFFERRALEAQLAQECEFNRAILDTVGALIVVLDAKGNIVHFNQACEKATGFTYEELRGKPIWDHLILPEERTAVQGIFQDLTAEKVNNAYENFWLTKGGGRRLISWHNTSQRGRAGQVAFVIATGLDITERKELEMKLSHGQKLESIGRLAAGIAHELNTPTQYVGDNTHFLTEAFDDLRQVLAVYDRLVDAARGGRVDPALIEDVATIREEHDLENLLEEIPRALEQGLEGLTRITEIVQAMKEFSHPGSENKVATDINRVIRNTATIARNEWKYCALLTLDRDPALPTVMCHGGEVGQVILNMIVNAAQAIGTQEKPSGAPLGRIAITTRHEDPNVVVCISDDGPGIPQQLQELVFDPFFTTKPVGKGSGQGLAISRAVITEKHGGDLTLTSSPEGGTTFAIALPINPPSEAAA